MGARRPARFRRSARRGVEQVHPQGRELTNWCNGVPATIGAMPDTASATDAFLDAIKAGDLERVKEMISADPGLIDAHASTGESVVLMAVYHRHKEIANLLVARGATLTLNEACAAGEQERGENVL